MARIRGVPENQAGPMLKLVYRLMRRGMKKLTGRDAAHGSGLEPLEVWAMQPKMMRGMGKFQQAVRNADGVDERTKNRPAQCGFRDRVGRVQPGNGVRAARPAGASYGPSPDSGERLT